MARALKKRSAAKSQRINFRASATEERLIRLGAEKRGLQVTRFIVQSACSAAEMALADEKHFELLPAQFARFQEALDRPARVVPALQKLFSERSVLERGADKAAALDSRTADF
jgi:uncharacterized protein (DUF1778 family)